jgi:hypothetical protein
MSQDRSGKRPPRPDHKATVFPHRRGRREIDTSRPLDDTTLLVLCPDDHALSDHRRRTRALGGIALHVGSIAALIDWLAAHRSAQAAVLLDDPRLSPQDSTGLAATLRDRFPDVAVLLLCDPDTALPQDLPAGCAVELLPLSDPAFAAAMTAARLSLPADSDDTPGPWTTPPMVRALPHDPSHHDDHVGRHSGRWIIPLLGLGVSFWVMLGMALFGDGERSRDTPSVFATTQLS